MRRLTCRLPLLLALLTLLAACGDGGGGDTDTDTRPDRDGGTINPIDVGDGGLPDITQDTITPDAGDAADDADAGDAPSDGSGDASDGDTQPATAFIDSVGGRIEFDRVAVTIPRNALAEETLLSIDFGDLEAPEGVEPLSPVYVFGPDGTTFAVAAGITVTLDEQVDDARIFWTTLGETTFEPIRTDVLDERVTGVITHFSYGFVGRYADDLCDGAPANACGGCGALTGRLGDPCGNGGTLACNDTNDALVCEGEAVCGDDVVGGTEECDGTALGGLGCTDFASYEGGTLGCTDLCAYDFSACEGPDPCEGVSCDVAPPGRCEGNTAISYAATGICVLGSCEFVETSEDCGDLTCSAGACVNAPGPSDLVITEFLADAAGGDDGFEWFEVWNATTRTIDLNGVVVRDNGSDSFTVNRPLNIGPGEYLVFAELPSSVPSGVDFAWDDVSPAFALANTDDEIILEFDGNIIDRVFYDGGFPTVAERSTTLDDEFQTAAGNENAEAWCEGVGSYGVDPNQGTPGAVNNDCNPPDPCDGVACDDPPSATCEGDVAVAYAATGTCDAGTCSYAEARRDCSLLGGCLAGACAEGASVPGAGDLVISEFLADPASVDTDQEWFEVWNALDEPLDLSGVVVRDDDSDAFTVPDGTIIGPRAYAVFAETTETVPGDVLVAWNELGRFTLTNSGNDAIELVLGEIVLDRVAITAEWPRAAGVATQLDRFSLTDDNALLVYWCGAETAYDGTNRGTPGAENGFCIDPCAEIVCDTPPAPICETTVAVSYAAEGVCFEGVCTYEPEPFDCATYGGCLEGACVIDPCAAVTCDDPPMDTCDGDVAVTWASGGVCDLGTCTYEETRTDCADFGGCAAAACVIDASAPGEGDLVITEIMADLDGSDDGFEWFELRNLSGGYLNLEGVSFLDDNLDSTTVDRVVLVEDGASVVIAQLDTAIPGDVAWAWDGIGRFGLGNTNDQLIVEYGGIVIDRVAWDTTAGWEIPTGASLSLDPAGITDGNDLPDAWCAGVGGYGIGTNEGTPNALNPACPIDLCADVTCDVVPVAACEGDVAVTYAEPGACVEGVCEWATSTVDCTDFGGCVDGACAAAPRAATTGDLILTEFMANPEGADPGFEWFELLVTAGEAVDLAGVTFADAGSDLVTLTGARYVVPGQRLVVAGSLVAVPDGVDIDWSTRGTYALVNTTDGIIVRSAIGDDIEAIDWDATWPVASGYATALDPSAEGLDRNDPANWCASRGDYGLAPNQGTPGVENIGCAVVICGDGLRQGDEECDDGNLETGDGCDDLCVVEPDPCADVTCDAPPTAFCDGTVAVTYPSTGVCTAGSCSYAETRTECAPDGECVDAACVSVGARPVAVGDLVITEFMADSDGAEPETEWFEVANVSGARLELGGMEIDDDGSDNHVVSGSLEIAPGAIFVFAATAGAVPGGVDYIYGIDDYALANGGDEIILRTTGGAVIDRVDYTGAWTTGGLSYALSWALLDGDNNEFANWCDGAGDYGVTGNEGTPGEANPDC